MADNGKKHMVIDLVANNSIFPRNMLHPMKCRIINAETGKQVGLVQKLELQFEVSSGGAWADGRVVGKLWKHDVTKPDNPGDPLDINFDELTEYTVTVRRILEKSPPRGDEYEKRISDEEYIAANRSAVLAFETGEQHRVAAVYETSKERTARCEALLTRRDAALKEAKEAATEAGVTLEMEHDAFVSDLVADAEKLAHEGATAGIHRDFMESPLCQKEDGQTQ